MIIHFDYGAKKMDNGKREAARIQKEQESIEIARLVCEIRPVISKIPTDYSGWDIIKTRQFKEFHALATKKSICSALSFLILFQFVSKLSNGMEIK